MKILQISLTVILLLCSYASAAVYYVDNSGNDSNSGLSQSSPWQTISKVNSKTFTSGDQILFKRGGTWYETLNINKDGILVGSYGSGTLPVIDGSMTRVNNIYMSGRCNIIIQEIKAINAFGSGSIRIKYSNNVTVRNCEFYVTSHGGVFIENSRNCTISGNNFSTPDFIDVQTDGIYSQRNNGNIYEKNYIVISNTADLQHNDGIQCYLDTSITARGNYIEQRNFKTGNAQGLYATDNFGRHFWYNNVINTPNIMANSMGFKNVDPGYYGTVEVYQNTVITKGGNALCVQEAPDFIAKNNIFISNGTSTIITVTGAINNFSNLNNNLYYGKTTTQQAAYLSIYGGNYTLQQLRAKGSEMQGQFGNPQLDANYLPISGSPAIDKGLNLSSPYNIDKAGTPRPQGSYADLGAMEKVVVPTGNPPLAPVVNAQALSSSSINLSWTDVAGETGYTVERLNGTWTSVGSLDTNKTSYSDNSLQASTKYTYRVRAFNSAGQSCSDTVSAITLAPPPPPPTPSDTTIAAMNGRISGGGLTIVSGSNATNVVYLDNRKGSIVIQVNIPVQTSWSLKGRFFYNSSSIGTYQVQVDNGTKFIFSTTKITNQWYWGSPVALGTLTPGLHTITITNNRPGSGAVIDVVNLYTGSSGVTMNEYIASYDLKNYPNPFNPTTTIRFELPKEEKTVIEVFDILGNLVKELTNETMPAGVHEVQFNASGYASGIYILRMRTETEVQTLKLNLLK